MKTIKKLSRDRPQSKYNNFRLHSLCQEDEEEAEETPICAVIKLMDMIRDLTSQMGGGGKEKSATFGASPWQATVLHTTSP